MALEQKLEFHKFLILPEFVADSNIFTNPCGLRSREFKIQSELAESLQVDCDNPDLPAWNDAIIKSNGVSASGSGMLEMKSKQLWIDWKMSGARLLTKILMDETAANKGGYFIGDMLLPELSLKADHKDFANLDLSLQGVGKWEYIALT